jgi:pimeloyl-ACP methyl ester carboxylesterase
VYVERYGTGERAYLGLHGWGSDRSVFAPLAAHVPADASFFSADMPGIGASPPPAEWEVDYILADIIGTICLLNVKSLTIVGHCGGAVFGLLAARTSPRLVERVVAVDPFAYMPRYFRLFTGERFGRRAYDATFANPLGRWVTNRTLNTGRDARTDLTASFGATDHEVARSYLRLFAALSVEEVRGLRTPVDLFYGEQTFGAVKKSVALLSEVLPVSRAVRLDGARHMPFTEATGQLACILFEPGRMVEDEQAATVRQRSATAQGG